MSTVIEKKRRPKARNRDIILGCVEERLSMLDDPKSLDMDQVHAHVMRLRELMQELRRSGGKETEE